MLHCQRQREQAAHLGHVIVMFCPGAAVSMGKLGYAAKAVPFTVRFCTSANLSEFAIYICDVIAVEF